MSADLALSAYEALADGYDELTADHDYEDWTATIEAAAREAGLHGRRMLDVACGTGKSFLPFADRGYEVVACDLSPAMARRAQVKAGGRARVEVHDMRALPVLGAFDLVCCLDDAVNYLLGAAELRSAVSAMAANLAPGGVLVFDTNTLRTLRTAFAELTVSPAADRVFVFAGLGSAQLEAGERTAAAVEVFTRRDGTWSRAAGVHPQRHHPEDEVRAAIAAAGLGLHAVRGFTPDGRLWDSLDEESHSKALYIARASAPEAGEGR
jgi:SAM-dependent methyltransferase